MRCRITTVDLTLHTLIEAPANQLGSLAMDAVGQPWVIGPLTTGSSLSTQYSKA